MCCATRCSEGQCEQAVGLSCLPAYLASAYVEHAGSAAAVRGYQHALHPVVVTLQPAASRSTADSGGIEVRSESTAVAAVRVVLSCTAAVLADPMIAECFRWRRSPCWIRL